MTTPPAPIRFAQSPPLWTGLTRSHADAMISGEAPLRVLITGPAGSGKSRLLRHLRRELAASGSSIVVARSHAEIVGTAIDDVLVVDDAQVLDVSQLEALIDRAAHPDAGLILAARPHPPRDAFSLLSDELERSQPAIVLGSVGRADLRAYVDLTDQKLAEACADDLIEVTGGTSWLISDSLAIHDPGACSSAVAHDDLHGALGDVIAHRLRTVPSDVRDLVERRCLGEREASTADHDGLALTAYSHGLLLQNGRPAPIVRTAVRATSSIDKVIRLFEDTASSAGSAPADGQLATLVDGIRDPHLADLLMRHGEAAQTADRHRARDLYRRARAAGADSAAVAIREARAEWELGHPEAASRLQDDVSIPADHPDHDAAADTAAAVWAARGLMHISDAVYRASPPTSAASRARATVAALAAADGERPATARSGASEPSIPSTLDVAMELLEDGLHATLATPAHLGLGNLVRAAEMYSAAHTSAPIPELPAVIAALAAVHLGEPETALTVLDRALEEHHGGEWAHDRLVLWRAWVALQLERAHDVEAALAAIAPRAHSLAPRERLLFDAVSVSIARRYHDAVALTTAWRNSRESLMRASFDLFGILPLGEFVVTAARVGEPERMETHFVRTLARLVRLGSPPLWAAHAHWAGIQRAILLGRPDDMKPHALALVAATPHSSLAAVMAQAGRVWTAVLAGTVDAEAVEASASALGTVGLAWDGARLAGHAAARTTDRRVSGRLLATARRLHPHEDVKPPTVENDVSSPSRPRTASDLSPRELEVAALVVQGKTYTEIGATIFISPRTAEHHIARIRRRLGATNRSDLIAKLRVALDDADGDASDSSRRASA